MKIYNQKRTIAYFVDDVSTSFVINDIKALAEKFYSIILFSIDKIEDAHELPSNVILIDGFMDWGRYHKMKIVLSNFYGIMGIYFRECYALKKILPIKKSIALIASNMFKTNEVLRQLNDKKIQINDIALFYSFWFYDCIYLAWLKHLNSNIKIISRAHSGDLYEDHISIRNNLLFRHFQLRKLNAVYPVSEMGTEYLRKKYPTFSNTFNTVYLGTKDHHTLNPFDPKSFVIVSCASFRHHKRIHKIAEALLGVERPVIWYHFGDENLNTPDPKISEYKSRKAALESKSNIKFYPMGFTSNNDLMDFYRKTPVHLFVSLSAVEGIPVSIMEAISFGIPILSTDVGGCAEIVNDKTGILIPLTTEISEISKILDAFPDSDKNTEAYRLNVSAFWQTKFNAKQNNLAFFDQIDALN